MDTAERTSDKAGRGRGPRRDARAAEPTAGTTTDAPARPHRPRWRTLWNRVRGSQLTIPGTVLVVTLAGGLILGDLEAGLAFSPPAAIRFTPQAAITVLSIVAGAMITTAGVVFSLVVMTLQQASGQFSPRLLPGLWRERGVQILVGLLLSTFTFSILTLARIDPDAETAPTLMVGTALLLALLSIVAIVVYLDGISRQQYVGRIMEKICAETLGIVRRMPDEAPRGRLVGTPAQVPDRVDRPLVVTADEDGWVQEVDEAAIADATEDGTVVRVETRLGAYLTAGTPLVTIWPHPSDDEVESLCESVRAATVVGATRDAGHDVGFGLRRLKDIAIRALSPSINDPATAIEAILRIGSILRPLLGRPQTPPAVRDEHGRILHRPYAMTHERLTGTAFDQIRPFAAEHPEVLIVLLRTLRMLRDAVDADGVDDSGEVRLALDHQAALAVEGARHAGMLPADLARVEAALR